MTEPMGSGLPRATIVHALPGRIRLRFPTHRGDCAFFDKVARRLSDAPGVHAVHANPVTASLLVLHDPENVEAVGREARERRLFDIGAALPATVPAVPPATVRGAPPSAPTPLNLAAAAFFGLGVAQALRGRFHGNATESFWNAYLLHASHGQPALSVGLVGLGLYQLATGNVLGSGVSLLLYGLAARNLAQGDAAEEPG